eukprot:1889575-Amphidinium_carterae.1
MSVLRTEDYSVSDFRRDIDALCAGTCIVHFGNRLITDSSLALLTLSSIPAGHVELEPHNVLYMHMGRQKRVNTVSE